MRNIFFGILLTFIVGASCYTNPVQGGRDSPDPGAIYHEGAYFAVTTGGWDGHAFPIWKSATGTKFEQVGWVFEKPPTWTKCCDYWAPQIHLVNGNFIVYYTARDSSGKLSIGAAQSSKILGPFTDRGSPLVTNSSEGVIDATILRNGATNFIVYKVDGNAHGHQTQFWAVLLDPTGMNTRGNPQLLLKNDQSWQRGIIEGQWFVQEGGYFYLFYSGCGYNNDCYSVGVARATSPLGPYTKFSANPILKTRAPMTSVSWEGPGHCSVIKNPAGEWLMFYHAWPHGGVSTKRLMLMDRVVFIDGWPKIYDGSPSQSEIPNPK